MFEKSSKERSHRLKYHGENTKDDYNTVKCSFIENIKLYGDGKLALLKRRVLLLM